MEKEGRGGHLAHASARFPDDSRLRLAAVQGRDVRTQAGGYRRWKLADDDLPSRLARAHAIVASAEPEPELLTAWRAAKTGAARQLTLLAELPHIKKDYVALTASDVAADALLRIGYIELRERRWTEALTTFYEARRRSDEPSIRYLTFVFSGLAHQRAGQHDEAIHDYRAALEIIPDAHSASLILASLLAGSDHPDDRKVAPALLASARPASDDPLTLFRLGDAIRVEQAIARVRRALKE
jgi:tetratricopeptide (TPR) repeat protein